MNYIIIIIAIIALLFLYLRWFEKNNIFFPSRHIDATPDSIGLVYEDVTFKASDGTDLNAWFIPASGSARGTILICHGNAGNISHRLHIIRIFHDMGLNVFIFDYRGYGKSHGRPSEKGMYLDAGGAYNYLINREDIDKNAIIVYGQSIGGAVAVDLASNTEPKLLITNSAFTSTRDMAKEIYPFLPAKLFITQEFDAYSKVDSIHIPKLIIHSTEDEIVPFTHGEKLFENAAQPKEFHAMRGGHNEAVFDYEAEFIAGVDNFLRKNGI
ncbi:MAG: alpha/beta hydrolase [Candidatus Omnitrophota bacterium]